MDLEVLLEAERRGILPPDKVEILAELRRRGVVPAADGPVPPSAGRVAPQGQDRGIGQILRENIMGDNDPTTQNVGERIGSAINKAGEAMTFGLIGDEASAAVAGAIPGGMGYSDRLAFERQQEEILERDNPALAFGSEVGGSVLGALLPFGAIGTAAKGAGLASRVGTSAAAGAGMGGTYGFMEGEGAEDRMRGAQTGAALGGAVGAVAPAIGGGVQRLAQSRANRRAIANVARNAPTSAQLREAGNRAYQAVDDAGVQIRPQSFDRARQDIVKALRSNTGFDELPGPSSLTPGAARTMQIMGEASEQMSQDPTAALPFRSLDQMRRQAGGAAANFSNPTDQRAAVEIISQLDDFVNRLSPDDAIAGDVDALKTALPRAREVWGQMSRSQLLDDAMEQSENYLSGGSSAIRNQFARILRNDKLSRGFSDAEKAAMRRVVQGTMPEQILNLLGGGLGQLTQMGAGFSIGGLPGAAAGMGTAALARRGSEAVTKRNAEIARALVAGGRMRGGLPVISEAPRRITEELMRRTAAVGPQ